MLTEGYNSENSYGEQNRAFEASFLRSYGAIPPPDSCAIDWQPSALTPVFYGVRDYLPTDGAPTSLRIFFPSLDGSVFYAPILEGCGRYSLILFAHGHCSGDDEHYLKWFHLPAQLARSGYVVVVPDLPSIAQTPGDNPPDLETVTQVIDWMRTTWQHQSLLLPSRSTAIAGHSYGALLAARFALNSNIAAFASLSGVWQELSKPYPIESLQIPMLFLMGGPEDQFTALTDAEWNALARPKHRVIFKNGLHFDYLPLSGTPCYNPRGPCRYLSAAAADLVTMFFAKYLPTELTPDLPDRVPDNLTPPQLVLTPEQAYYAGGHLIGYKQLQDKPECEVSLEWDTPDTVVPYVRFTPQSLAAKQIRRAQLEPVFAGPTGPGVAWVYTQTPAPGTSVPIGSNVKMVLRVGPIP